MFLIFTVSSILQRNFTQCFQNLEFEVGFCFAPHPQGSNYICNVVSLRALI